MEKVLEKKQNYEQSAKIDRFEDVLAVLILEDGQEIKWPIKKMPDDIKEGMLVRVKISTTQSEEEEQKKLAKELINEILSNEI